MPTAYKVSSEDGTVHVYKNEMQSWDLKIENHGKTGHKAAGSTKRKEIQFRPIGFIESNVYFTCCFFLQIYCLLHLETSLIAEMQNPSHMIKEKGRAHNGACSLRKAVGSDWSYSYMGSC